MKINRCNFFLNPSMNRQNVMENTSEYQNTCFQRYMALLDLWGTNRLLACVFKPTG